MKITRNLLIALLIAITSSCAKDDIDNISNSELIGFWRISDVHFEGTSTTNATGNEVISSFTGTGYNLALSIDFDENENAFTSRGSYNIQLITNVDGKDVITEWMNPGFIECGTWDKDGNNLAVSKPNGEMQVATVLSTQQNTLELSYDFSYELMKSEATVIYNVNGIYRFEKQ